MSFFEVKGLNDEELVNKILKYRSMLASKSCYNHEVLNDSIEIHLAILEEEYECRMNKARFEASLKKPKKNEAAADQNIYLGTVDNDDEGFDSL